MGGSLTCVRVDLVACIMRVNMTTAQTYNKSHIRTVVRIYTLLPSFSIPREASRVNHAGSIHEPLQTNCQRAVHWGVLTLNYTLPHNHETYAVRGG